MADATDTPFVSRPEDQIDFAASDIVRLVTLLELSSDEVWNWISHNPDTKDNAQSFFDALTFCVAEVGVRARRIVEIAETLRPAAAKRHQRVEA